MLAKIVGNFSLHHMPSSGLATAVPLTHCNPNSTWPEVEWRLDKRP